jgi:glycosyltransferase involved in cell wall biosynthesis
VKALTIVDWPENGEWIWGALPEHNDRYDIVTLQGVQAPHTRIEKLTIYPLRYILAGLRVLPMLKHHHVVFSWEVKCGLMVALYQRLFFHKRPAHVIVGLIVKGAVLQHHRLARWLLSSVAGVVCFTRREAKLCRELLALPEERIHFCHLVWDVSEDEDVSPDEWDESDYVLSVGSSSRDYQTFLKAAAQVDARFILVAHRYNLTGLQVPPNVQVRYDLPSAEVTYLLRGARLVVLPLLDGDYSAGQTVLIRAMSAARAVVVTRSIGVLDYVRDGETGIFVQPRDADDMAATIQRLLRSPEETRRIGANARREAVARYGFAALARYLCDLAHTLSNEPDTSVRSSVRIEKSRR